MILELLEYCLTPAPTLARKLGFLRSSLQVRSRYLRCRNAWEPHLQQTRNALLETVEACTSRRTVVVLGAGLLHDIPLEALASAFQRVLLVDAVHTLAARFASHHFSNVHRITADVTGCAAYLKEARNPKTPLPQSIPALLLEDTSIDLILSVNLLSQLGWIPGQILDGFRTEEEIDAFKSHLIRAHLDYLRRLPGRTALITDFTWSRYPSATARREPLSRWSVLQEVRLPPPTRTWDWEIAPAPEKEKGVDWVAHVAFFTDWKRAGEESNLA